MDDTTRLALTALAVDIDEALADGGGARLMLAHVYDRLRWLLADAPAVVDEPDPAAPAVANVLRLLHQWLDAVGAYGAATLTDAAEQVEDVAHAIATAGRSNLAGRVEAIAGWLPDQPDVRAGLIAARDQIAHIAGGYGIEVGL